MIDPGLLITGIAASAAMLFGKGRIMRRAIFASWLISLITFTFDAPKSVVVLNLSLMDLLIAWASILAVHRNNLRLDARLIGGISLALMPLHFVMSATSGGANWLLYASVCNAAFVIQCLIVGGWADDVARRVLRFVLGPLPVFSFRNRGR